MPSMVYGVLLPLPILNLKKIRFVCLLRFYAFIRGLFFFTPPPFEKFKDPHLDESQNSRIGIQVKFLYR